MANDARNDEEKGIVVAVGNNSSEDPEFADKPVLGEAPEYSYLNDLKYALRLSDEEKHKIGQETRGSQWATLMVRVAELTRTPRSGPHVQAMHKELSIALGKPARWSDWKGMVAHVDEIRKAYFAASNEINDLRDKYVRTFGEKLNDDIEQGIDEYNRVWDVVAGAVIHAVIKSGDLEAVHGVVEAAVERIVGE